MASTDPTKRITVKAHRGISYRLRADGERRYSVYFRGRYISEADDGTPLLRLDTAVERQGQSPACADAAATYSAARRSASRRQPRPGWSTQRAAPASR
jgi:hypothetical protein